MASSRDKPLEATYGHAAGLVGPLAHYLHVAQVHDRRHQTEYGRLVHAAYIEHLERVQRLLEHVAVVDVVDLFRVALLRVKKLGGRHFAHKMSRQAQICYLLV